MVDEQIVLAAIEQQANGDRDLATDLIDECFRTIARVYAADYRHDKAAMAEDFENFTDWLSQSIDEECERHHKAGRRGKGKRAV